ncbi:MAG: N-6 DNA methylase [Bacteroidales bacterium]|nr:N-6 DNA methylase [Bacteroidales bacterium]
MIKKYVNGLDQAMMDEKFSAFQNYFADNTRQENIRNSKEEQFQEGFFRELFVNVLGYTLNPDPGFNLSTEFKNVSDSRKADGAILKDKKAVAVIELKSTNTTDLDTVETQAFGYKNNNPGCAYVITSNFEKLRFYIHNAVDYIEFDLFRLSRERFALLWLLLAKDSLLSDVPQEMKKASVLQEEDVTKKLYADYSKFREELYHNLVQNNPDHDKLLLFRKTQKLLDRFLFIFFAEDKLLLPPNSISRIVQQWADLKDSYDEYFPLYHRFKKYFGYLNKGFKGEKYEIFPYNGGLFKPDDILDSITIDDEILRKHTLRLSGYDFETDVDVNILGHIFEHSIGEIEHVQAEIQGEAIDRQKTQRKKEGIFYTPKYITKYIVENTVGRLCVEKRNELGIVDEEYTRGRRNRKKATLKALSQKLDDYREWLLSLTILDPACGSGAFLNQALDFLIKEHGKIDELRAELMGDSLVLSDITNDILEKNIYGVDLNEESVEIAKLSLWLRTAQKGRKLNTLSQNIKCGNSLIDDPAVAGDKAFRWEEEFPEVFKRGGFDVVIGNPPYVRVQGLRTNFKNESVFYENNFKSATGRFDIYILFIEKAHKLISKRGNVSFILPHKFLVASFGTGIRNYLAETKAVKSIVHFGSELVFEEASTYTCILTLSHDNETLKFAEIQPQQLFSGFRFDWLKTSSLNQDSWNLVEGNVQTLFEKLESSGTHASKIFSKISRGVVTGADGVFILEGEIVRNTFKGFSKELNDSVELEAELVHPIIMGNSLSRYCDIKNDLYILYPHKFDGKTLPITPQELEKNYPRTFEYLSKFEELLVNKKIKYKTDPKYWTALHNSRTFELFQSEKIITPYLSKKGQMSLDKGGIFFTNDKCSSLVLNDYVKEPIEYFLGVLNSSLTWFYISKTSSEYSGGYFAYTKTYLSPFPIPVESNLELSSTIADTVKSLLELSVQFGNIENSLLQLLISKFSIEKPTKKLQNWPELEFKDFLKELKKQKVKLSLSEESEWMQYFNEQKQKASDLQSQITQTDREIDRMVYELYGLTEEEIKIVEESVG